MNYLAHAFLSFGQPEVLAGNLISDFVKGKKQFDYSAGIQRGIRLHRAIDEFTDNHPATRAAREVFRPAYRLYAGAFVDVVYDHFLACDPQYFTPQSQKEFSAAVYRELEQRLELLPERFRRIFPHMKKDDWLYNYRYTWGIEKSFGGLVYRAAYLEESTSAITAFHQHYFMLADCYRKFFPELKDYSFKLFVANS